MKAILLAAGLGRRLGLAPETPKALLEFGGQTLLQRHLHALHALGVSEVTLCTGYAATALVAHAEAITPRPALRLVDNPDYAEGSVVSLWATRDTLLAGEPVLLMDADVLYAPALLARLASSLHPDCALLDRHCPEEVEPVKLLLRDGRAVEFAKQPDFSVPHEVYGESVGFFKFAPATAARLAAQTGRYVHEGRRQAPHEDVIRDLVLNGELTLGVEDITGQPWVEIDFPDDVRRARDDILPRLAHD